MKIKFNDDRVPNRHPNLRREIMASAPTKVVFDAMDKEEFDVQLIINGTRVKAALFDDMVNRIDEYIKKEAKKMVAFMIEDTHRIYTLQEVIDTAIRKLMEEFDITKEDVE